MKTIRRFEELKCWQVSRELHKELSAALSTSWKWQDRSLQNQIRRASQSVCANIAEGFERGGNRELTQFLSAARGSAGEVRAFLHMAYDSGQIDPEVYEKLRNLSLAAASLISSFFNYLVSSDLKGKKYRPTEKSG